MKKFFIALIAFFIVLFGAYFGYKNYQKKQKIKTIEIERKQLDNVLSKYSKIAKTNKDATLYTKDNNDYVTVGSLSKNYPLNLTEEKFNKDTKYFNIANTEYYVSINDVEKLDSLNEYSTRYKSYIPFDQNIETKDTVTFTDEFDNKITLNKSFELPIIIKEDDKYGVELYDHIYYVDKSDVANVINHVNSNAKKKDKILTLTYHFLYDKETDKCNQGICQELGQFESHLKYMKENNFLTITLDEMDLFLDGKINLPYNSVAITIDDGTIFNTKAIKLLEKYDAQATLFVITGWVTNLERFSSKNLKLESHTDKMHNQYECKGMGLQGGGILCKDEEYVLNDLKTCQEKLGGSKYFAYPFFDVNDRAIALLKKAGYKLAFVGQANTNGFATPNKTNKYKVPRKTVFSFTTMNDIKKLLS